MFYHYGKRLVRLVINVSSMKSAEGATPNRAVRKGCYIDVF